VVIARGDPSPVASGGCDRLRTAGIAVDVIDDCTEATAVSDAFVHRVRTGLPWVTVKWAQTIDGRIATRAGQPRWISNEVSRRMVHRERGRVDVILTGIGTVLADDPLLTARNVRVRRVARRVVVDPTLKLPPESSLVQTARSVPVMVAYDQKLVGTDEASQLRARGVEVVGFQMDGRELPLAAMLRDLVARFDAANVLVEAGAGLMSRLFQQKLVNEAWVFLACGSMTADHGPSALAGFDITGIAQQFAMREINRHHRKGDTVIRFRVGP
jgi:diaminohydroxyphosphoribosylaminopyrimidine deaminase/5-amino-6-(5-phosphoribosylamino)uracil reductase